MRRRPHKVDGSLPLKVRHRTLGRALQGPPSGAWNLLGSLSSGMLPPHPLDLRETPSDG
jgi:hypothetical protein